MSMSLEYEPASEPLHMSVKELCLNVHVQGVRSMPSFCRSWSRHPQHCTYSVTLHLLPLNPALNTPQPYTWYPQPYTYPLTLHLVPSTLHLLPLNPTLGTLNPELTFDLTLFLNPATLPTLHPTL